jgi:HNH endonuclease
MKSLEERFLTKINKTEAGCWEWTAFKNKLGYGQISMGRRGEGRSLAHRVSYSIYKESIPAGMLICHACDNPGCVNPDHLFMGSQSDNMRDCSNKGRVNKSIKLLGEKHARSKLSEDDVRLIRSTKGRTTELSKQLGITTANIKYIRRGETWRHVV